MRNQDATALRSPTTPPVPIADGGRMCMLAAFFFEWIQAAATTRKRLEADNRRLVGRANATRLAGAAGISERYDIKYIKPARSAMPTDLCSADSGMPSTPPTWSWAGIRLAVPGHIDASDAIVAAG